MIPFSFQRELKKTGCEDAPPIATRRYSIVCDGLGASGLASCGLWDETARQMVYRTNAYVGSRLVSDSVAQFYDAHIQSLADGGLAPEAVKEFAEALRAQIKAALDAAAEHYQVEAPQGRSQLVFPTTLASALYFPTEKGQRILAIWAGDSRIYLLTADRGLQLLSLDDAEGADGGMLSRSDMNNCICQGAPFWLNYGVYEVEEPGIVLCCTDGCTDYLPSPLNFEWLLLNTICERLPDCSGEALGAALAERLRDDVYAVVNDDTTMAGICLNMDSAAAMSELFGQRMKQFGPIAVDMNETLALLHRLENEQADDRRTCEVCEARALDTLSEAIARCAEEGGAPRLLELAPVLTEDDAYRRAEEQIQADAERNAQNYEMERRKNCSIAERRVKELLKADYLKQRSWGYESENRKLRNKSGAPDVAAAVQYLLTMIELYQRPELAQKLQVDYAGETQDTEAYLAQQIMAMESAVTLLKKSDSDFLSGLWIQAYYSTDYYQKLRDKLDQDRNFLEYYEKAKQDPGSVKGVSFLTAEQIRHYQSISVQQCGLPKPCVKEMMRQKQELQQRFLKENSRDIAKRLLEHSNKQHRSDELFELPLMQRGLNLAQIDGFEELTAAKQRIEQRKDQLQQVAEHSAQLWQAYRVNHERFRHAQLERTDDA